MSIAGGRGLLVAAALLVTGCAGMSEQPVSPHAAGAEGCDPARPAPLLDAALADAGLGRADIGISDADLLVSPYARHGALDDPDIPALVRLAYRQPWQLGCAHDRLVARLDAAAAGATPASDLLDAMAALLGERPAEMPAPPAGRDLASALGRLCGKPGCPTPAGSLPPSLAAAIAPLLHAAADAAQARERRYAEAGLAPSIAWDSAPGNAYRQMFGPASVPPYRQPAAQRLMEGEATARFHAAAIRLARAVELAGLERRVRDAGAHHYDDADGPFLLLLDLGGDDRYRGAAAATRPGHPVSVLVDLAGDDDYGYPGVERPRPHPLLLPDDGHGREHGALPRSLSVQSRQAAARDGVALLLDLGGDDRYRSHAQSQAYAALGVAALLDAGGDDLYEAELLAQGAAAHGLAVAVDLGGGDDRRLAFSGAQGFAHAGAAALLYDDGGDDRYLCPNGRPEHGGLPLYPSSQMRERGTLSFCQGAAFGIRGDRARVWRPGGVGVLRDRGGDDHYTGSVYAQGVGYWQGAGLLADGAGDDRYDGDWYVQGASAHYGLGMLADAAGDDVYGAGWAASNMQAGAGHDFGVGVLVDESGDDRYHLTSLSAGAANCSGLGVLVDNAGDDRYLAASELSLGMGGVGPECRPHREGAHSTGVMLDAGGTDRYVTPGGERPLPADGHVFGHAREGLPVERGMGRDGDEESGLHIATPGS